MIIGTDCTDYTAYYVCLKESRVSERAVKSVPKTKDML